LADLKYFRQIASHSNEKLVAVNRVSCDSTDGHPLVTQLKSFLSLHVKLIPWKHWF